MMTETDKARGGAGRTALYVIWLAWLMFCVFLTAGPFDRQIQYFRRPGAAWYMLILGLLPAILILCGVYNKYRPALVKYELPVLAGAPIVAALAYDPRAAATVSVMLLACYGAGNLTLTRFVRLSPAEEIPISIGLGLALMAFILFPIGLLGLFRVPVFAAMLLPPLWRAPRLLQSVRWIQQRWVHAGSDLWMSFGFVFGLIFILCGAAVMLAPSIAYDVLAVHLPSAQHYAAQHRLAPLPFNPYSYFPQSVEILMTAGYALAGQTAAQMVPPVFFVLSAMICLLLARRAGLPVPAAQLAVLCAAAMPFLHWTGSVAKNDLALAFFELASLYGVIRWKETEQLGWLMLAAFFLAAACGVKNLVLFGGLPLLVLMLSACRRHAHPWRAALTVTGILMVFGLVWQARDFILTGNPVYPEQLSRSGAVRLRDAVSPYSVLFGGRKSFASPLACPAGVFFALFAPMWALSRRRSHAACLFFTCALLAYWALIWPVLRFAIAGLMVLTVLTVGKLHGFMQTAPPLARISVNAALAYSLLFSLTGTMIIEINAPQLLLLARRIDREEYLRRALATYPAMEFLKSRAGPKDLILGVDNCSAAYAPVPWNFSCAPLRDFRFVVAPAGKAPSGQFTEEYRDNAFVVLRNQSLSR